MATSKMGIIAEQNIDITWSTYGLNPNFGQNQIGNIERWSTNCFEIKYQRFAENIDSTWLYLLHIKFFYVKIAISLAMAFGH